MKKNFEQILKSVVAIVLVSLTMSSCVVKERTYRRPPPPQEKVIIRP